MSRVRIPIGIEHAIVAVVIAGMYLFAGLVAVGLVDSCYLGPESFE